MRKIFVATDSPDNVYSAYTDENRAKSDADESGVTYVAVPFAEGPAPTVATDNSGEKDDDYSVFSEWYESQERRFHCAQMDEKQIAYSSFLHGKSVASPVEEEQNELWKELIDLYDIQDASSYGYGVLINKLSEKFILTRKK